MAKRRRNAVNKTFQNLLNNPFIYYENGKLLILSDSRTETDEAKFYETWRRECRLIEPGSFPPTLFGAISRAGIGRHGKLSKIICRLLNI